MFTITQNCMLYFFFVKHSLSKIFIFSQKIKAKMFWSIKVQAKFKQSFKEVFKLYLEHFRFFAGNWK